MPPLSYEPEYNILAAMVRWVEDDIPPDALYAVYWNNNNVTDGVGFVRPLCQVSDRDCRTLDSTC